MDVKVNGEQRGRSGTVLSSLHATKKVESFQNINIPAFPFFHVVFPYYSVLNFTLVLPHLLATSSKLTVQT